jgi:hypothetical protein
VDEGEFLTEPAGETEPGVFAHTAPVDRVAGQRGVPGEFAFDQPGRVREVDIEWEGGAMVRAYRLAGGRAGVQRCGTACSVTSRNSPDRIRAVR